MTFFKNLIMGFEGSYEVILRTNIFDLQIFENETTALIKFFEICTKMHFFSLYFFSMKEILQPPF